MGPFFALVWAYSFIPIPWIAEQKNIVQLKKLEKKELKIILRSRIVEQFILVECFQIFFISLAILGNFLHANAIKDYTFDLLSLRVLGFFLLMIGIEWFYIVHANYIAFHNLNYLRFTYFDLIPKKRPLNVSIIKYNEVISKLRRPYQFKAGLLGLMLYSLLFFSVIFCIPVAFYMLYKGNYPPSFPSSNLLLMQYVPYEILLLEPLFIIAGIFLWFKLPKAIQTIPEELYSIPPHYLDFLQSLQPHNRMIIAELQNSTYDQSIDLKSP